MATTPYPLPRELRKTAILLGNGGLGPYGPTAFRIFDTDDIIVLKKAAADTLWSTATVIVTKTAALNFDTVSVTFIGAGIPNSTQFVILSRRLHERTIAVLRSGAIDADQLEKELSKQATVIQELRRDVDNGLQLPPGTGGRQLILGSEGYVLKFAAAGNVVPGPSVLDIETAAANAAAAVAAANAAMGYAAAASAALAGLVPSFQTYALAQATVLPPLIKTARMLGYFTAGDCPEFLVARVNSQPTHALKFRSSIDKYLADGVTVDNTNGGWWEFQLPSTIDIMQCGAKRHSTADSAPAVQAAVAYIEAKYAYGAVFFPPSNAPWTFASMVENAVYPITYYSNNQDTSVHCGPNDITVFKLTAKHSMLRDLTIYGKGCSNLPLADNTFGVSKPTVHIPAGSVSTVIDHCIINGGTECVRWEGGDCKIYRTEMENAYGLAETHAVGGSGWMHRCALDQKWHSFPGYQTQPATIPDWAPSTPYALNAIVKLNGFIIQCRPSVLTGTGGAGTSGGTAPALKNYLTNIVDGTVNWLLLAPTVYSAFVANTGSSEISLLQMDLSGPYDYSVKLINSNPNGVGSPQGPRYIDIGLSTISAAFVGGVLLSVGSSFTMTGVHGGGGCCADSAAVRIASGFTRASIHHNEIQGGAYGLDAQGGSRIFFSDNWVDPTPAATGVATAVRIRNTVGRIQVKNNEYGSATIIGTQIDAGTGDDIHVCDNMGAGLATLCVDNRPGKLRSVVRETH